jgi:methionyl aminopeptidase
MDNYLEAKEKMNTIFKYIEGLLNEYKTAFYLDQYIESMIIKEGCEPVFKGYNGFPAVSCISVNDEVVHGIPTKEKVFKKGDLISVDIGIKYKGIIIDEARTFIYGACDWKNVKLVRIGERILDITKNYMHYTWKDQEYSLEALVDVLDTLASLNHVNYIHGFGGHKVNPNLHEDPYIPNRMCELVDSIKDYKFKPGDTICIEPMITFGSGEVYKDKDGWTIKTKDGMPAVHFEETIMIYDRPTDDYYHFDEEIK